MDQITYNTEKEVQGKKEIFYRRVEFKDPGNSNINRILMLVMCIIICFLIIFRYNRTLNLLRYTGTIQPKTSFLQSGLLHWFLLEFFICAAHSSPGVPFAVFKQESKTKVTNKHGEEFLRTESIEYTNDTLITFVCFIKLYLVWRMFLHDYQFSWFYKSFFNPYATIVTSQLDIKIDLWFTLRADIISQPFKWVLFILITVTPTLAFLIRLAELPFLDVSDAQKNINNKVDMFEPAINALYTAFMALATLGLGQYPVSTIPGRIFTCVGFLFGNAIMALLIYGVSDLLAFDEEEERADQMIKKASETATLHDRAADVLREALRLNKTSKKRDG